MRGEKDRFIKVGVTSALIGAGGIICIVLILQADLHRQSVSEITALQQQKKASKKIGDDALSSLIHDEDVAQPVHSKLSALSFDEIMRENNDDVDNLGPAFDPIAGHFVGPDGLSDIGDVADISLLNTLTSANQHDADKMNAKDSKFGVGTLFHPKGVDMGGIKKTHDMSTASARIDAKSTAQVESFQERKGTFRRATKTPISDIAPAQTKSKFHKVKTANNVEGRSEGVPMSSRFSLIHHDGQMRIGQVLADPFSLVHPHNEDDSVALGLAPAHHASDDITDSSSDSEAEILVDPDHAAVAARTESPNNKGIWVEPGSNKGFDSYALDSLQIAGDKSS